MSSKTKDRLQLAIDENRKIKLENQRLKRGLTALLLEYGELTVTYASACRVSDDDIIAINFDKVSGKYTIRLVGEDNADRLGSESEGARLSRREGDVGGDVPEGEPDNVVKEVREGDQHNPSED